MYTHGWITRTVSKFPLLNVARFLDSVCVYDGLEGKVVSWAAGQKHIITTQWESTTIVIVLANQ